MSTVDIIKDIVEALSFTIPVDSVVDNLDGTITLNVKNTFHQSATNCPVTLDSKTYTVTGIVTDQEIILTDINSAGPPSITEFVLAAPKFFHGTAIDVNNEVINFLTNSVDKFPMVYLFEKFTETHNDERDSIIDRTASVRLFCLDQSEFGEWDTNTHYNNVIDSMKNLTEELIDVFISNGDIGKFDSHQTINWVNFGRTEGEKGQTQKVFDDFCSGVELRIDLPIFINTDCPC